MKNIKWCAGACLLALGLIGLPSCSDNNEAVAPVFPENVVELNVASAGEQVEFTFSANADWTLTSSKLWCKFVSENQSVPMLAGGTGEQKALIVVTDDIWGFEPSVAEISLNMGGQAKVVAKVTRGAKSLLIEGYDQEHPFEIKYIKTGVSAVLDINANFDWVLSEIPEWLQIADMPLQGYANRAYEIKVQVPDVAKVSAQNGVLNFKMKDSELGYSFPVEYAGMGKYDLESSLNAWAGWIVSSDGKQYGVESSMGGDTEMKDLPLSFTVAAKDNDYKALRYFRDPQYGVMPMFGDPEKDFFTISDDGKGNLSVNQVNVNSGKEREGYLMVLPAFVADSLGVEDDPEAVLDLDAGEFKEELDGYIALALTQKAGESQSGGFIVKNGGIEIPCEPGDGGSGFMDFIVSEMGVSESDVYAVKVASNAPLVVDPMLSMEEWNPSTGIANTLRVLDFETSPVAVDSWELGLSSDETRFTVNFIAQQQMMIGFKDPQNMTKKVLVVVFE